MSIAKYLIEKGANLSLRNNVGQTPLDIVLAVSFFLKLFFLCAFKDINFVILCCRDLILTLTKLYVCFYCMAQILMLTRTSIELKEVENVN